MRVKAKCTIEFAKQNPSQKWGNNLIKPNLFSVVF